MKKVLALLLISFLCICLTACDPASYFFDNDDLLDNLTDIQLINYDNTLQKSFKSWVPNHYSKLVNFDFDNMTILEILDDSYKEEFIRQLAQQYILHTYYAYNSPNNICLRLLYANGDFIIINCAYKNSYFGGYIGKYDSEGNVIDFYGCSESLYSFTS